MLDYSKGGFYMKDTSVFKEMLIVNSLRGSHSTGIFGGKINDESDFAKGVGNPYDFINHPEVQPMFQKMISKYKYVVGHGRHATRGSIIGEFAHPFKTGHITMSHNGTIYSSKLIDVQKNVSDSKAICEALAHNDALDVFQDINGAFAIIYHDEKRQQLSMIHNKERPLCIGLDEKNDRVYFSSEKGILSVVANRNGITFKELFYMPEDVLFSFDKDSYNFTETPVPKKVVFFPVVKPVVASSSQGAKITKITSPSTGEQIILGDELTFKIREIVEYPNRKGSISYYQVFGEVVSFPEVEISFIWKGEEEDLYKSQYWDAKISSIVMASPNMIKKGVKFILYASEPKHSDFLLTFDGTFKTKDDFVAGIKHGCTCCKSEIKEIDCEETLFQDGYVLCPKCSIAFYNEDIKKRNVK